MTGERHRRSIIIIIIIIFFQRWSMSSNILERRILETRRLWCLETSSYNITNFLEYHNTLCFNEKSSSFYIHCSNLHDIPEWKEFSKVLIHNLMIHNLKSYNCVRVKSIDIRVKSISNCVEFWYQCLE
jgi:hypothetical protein